jgi:alkylation response protein AidB-like acyl-CoA dehydrogenase
MIVDLEPTDDQRLIEDSINGLLNDRLPISRLRETINHAGRAEVGLWSEFAGLGLFGMGLSDDKGGFGYGLPEEMLAARALGLHLASPSVLAQMAAAHIASDALRGAIVSGEVKAAFATRTVTGEIQVIDGADAQQVVLLGAGAALVSLEVLGTLEPVSPMDETISLARAGGVADTLRNADADRISLLAAAYLVGVAQAATDMAVEYAGTREQFGQPIGSFQAIKHICADMAVRATAADAQARFTAITFGVGGDDRREVAAARWLASDAALANAKANIQVHGGMGFTAECDAHLFLKRAHLFTALGSSRRAEERRLIGALA